MKNCANAWSLFSQLPTFPVREQKIVLDADLAVLYGVPTKRLNQQVRRHPERFPKDFAFLLTAEEWEALRLQIATQSGRRPHRRFLPYAFTEQGALMASGILTTPQAIECSIQIARSVGMPSFRDQG